MENKVPCINGMCDTVFGCPLASLVYSILPRLRRSKIASQTGALQPQARKDRTASLGQLPSHSRIFPPPIAEVHHKTLVEQSTSSPRGGLLKPWRIR